MTPEIQELIAAGDLRKAELTEMAGGLLSSRAVAPLFNMPEPSIEEQRKAGTIIAVRAGVDYGYPACQFEPNGMVLGLWMPCRHANASRLDAAGMAFGPG